MPNNQQGINEKLPEGNQFWLKELGHKVLAKIYEKDATPGNANELGSIAQSFEGVYQDSGLDTEELAISLYHQKDRMSFAKVVKGINRLLTSNKDLVNARQDYLTQVASVVWAVKDLADKQGDCFARGSIKINDPCGKLFNFLKGYVQFATGAEQPGYILGANDFAYNRSPAKKLSSHYTTFETEQYGIDMRFTGGKPTLEILPNDGDSHLLFGRVKIKNDWYTFMKAEPVGLGHPLEYVEHAGHLLLPKKQHLDITRKEKDIPKPLKDAYKKYYVNEQFYYEPNPDVAGMSRREWHNTNLPLTLKKWHTKATTVADMYRQIKNEAPKTQKGIIAKWEFKKALKDLGFKKDVKIRTGNEVILDLHELPELTEEKNPPQSYLVKREASSENPAKRQKVSKKSDSTDHDKTVEREPNFQGGSSKRLRK